MKTALCLSGIVGGTGGRNSYGGDADYALCSEHFKKYVIEPNNCDVFIHSWSVEHKENLIKLYEPRASSFEPQIDFSPSGTKPDIHLKASKFRFRSKWYSVAQSIKLLEGYENYDWVIVSRFDLMFLQTLDLSKLDNTKLYAPNYSTFPKDSGRERWEFPQKCNVSLHKPIIHDFYYIASYDNIVKLVSSEPEDWFYHTTANPHKANRARILSVGLLDIVDYWGHRGYEYDLYRWRIGKCKQ